MEPIFFDKSKTEDPENIFFFMVGCRLQAYGWSAYVLSKCLPCTVLSEKVSEDSGKVLFLELKNINILTDNKNFRLQVSDDYVKINILNNFMRMNLPKWMEEYKQQNDSGCFNGLS